MENKNGMSCENEKWEALNKILDDLRVVAKSERDIYRVNLMVASNKVNDYFDVNRLINKDYFWVNPKHWGVELSLSLRNMGDDKRFIRLIEKDEHGKERLSPYFHVSLILDEKRVLPAFGKAQDIEAFKEKYPHFKDFFVPGASYLMMVCYAIPKGVEFVMHDGSIGLYENASEFIVVRI